MLMTTDMTESSVANVGPSPTPPPQVTGKIHTLSLQTESTPEVGCVVDQIAIISSRNGVLIFFSFITMQLFLYLGLGTMLDP